MTKEKIDLLIKDLCTRSSSGVICSIYREDDKGFGWRDAEYKGYFQTNNGYEFYFEDVVAVDDIENIKPYLRSMYTMTDEEAKEYLGMLNDIDKSGLMNHNFITKVVDWLDKKMFDHRGLIPKRIALEAPEGMYQR
jgi:hypothetical protein